MTKSYKFPTGNLYETSLQLFGALDATRLVGKGCNKTSVNSGVSFSQLYIYATRPDEGADREFEHLIESDPNLSSDFAQLLKTTSVGYCPRVAAASTGPIMSRKGTGCNIRFERSRAEPSQTYVIIEFQSLTTKEPSALFVCDETNRCRKFPVKESRNGVIQLLEEQDSELLRLLLDIKTEVYLG